MRRTSLEQPVQRSDSVGEIQRAVAIEVESGRTIGLISPEEEVAKHRDRITDIDSRVLVVIARDLQPSKHTWIVAGVSSSVLIAIFLVGIRVAGAVVLAVDDSISIFILVHNNHRGLRGGYPQSVGS